jgi:hypothetical protein
MSSERLQRETHVQLTSRIAAQLRKAEIELENGFASLRDAQQILLAYRLDEESFGREQETTRHRRETRGLCPHGYQEHVPCIVRELK